MTILSDDDNEMLTSYSQLDKVVDKKATGQKDSNIDCTDFGNTANCPLPSPQDCKDPTKFTSPVCEFVALGYLHMVQSLTRYAGYWMQVAFHNFNGYNSAMHDAAGWEAVQNSLDIAGIASDVGSSWNTDAVNTATLYNHVAAGESL